MHRHQRRAIFFTKTDHTALPGSIANAARAHTRHFACREDNQSGFVIEVLVYRFNRSAGGLAVHGIDWQ